METESSKHVDSKSALAEPTAEMVEFYEARTHQHIQRVRNCLELLAQDSKDGEELLSRAASHDASKFEVEERIPYIWLTEFHRCRWRKIPFTYPDGMEQEVERAIQHHMLVNRHHPDFHSDPNEMTDIDLMEMVCDWTAMAQEFDEANGSAKSWADRTIGQRVDFSTEKARFIYEVIELLDHRLRASG